MQTLYIKIFEFNTETYYKKTLQEFSPEINLDGLVASNEKVVDTFKDRPSTSRSCLIVSVSSSSNSLETV